MKFFVYFKQSYPIDVFDLVLTFWPFLVTYKSDFFKTDYNLKSQT